MTLLQAAFELFFNSQRAGQAQAAPTDPAALHTLYELYRDPDQVHTRTSFLHPLPQVLAQTAVTRLSRWCVVRWCRAMRRQENQIYASESAARPNCNPVVSTSALTAATLYRHPRRHP